MSLDLNRLDELPRAELIALGRQYGLERPERMTRVELKDELIRVCITDAALRDRSRGWLGVARDLVASVVEAGLHMPDAAKVIRGDVQRIDMSPRRPPVATVTLAEIYAAQGHTKRAVRMLQQVLQKEPDHEVARGLLDQLTPRAASEASDAPVVPPAPGRAALGSRPQFGIRMPAVGALQNPAIESVPATARVPEATPAADGDPASEVVTGSVAAAEQVAAALEVASAEATTVQAGPVAVTEGAQSAPEQPVRTAPEPAAPEPAAVEVAEPAAPEPAAPEPVAEPAAPEPAVWTGPRATEASTPAVEAPAVEVSAVAAAATSAELAASVERRGEQTGSSLVGGETRSAGESTDEPSTLGSHLAPPDQAGVLPPDFAQRVAGSDRAPEASEGWVVVLRAEGQPRVVWQVSDQLFARLTDAGAEPVIRLVGVRSSWDGPQRREHDLSLEASGGTATISELSSVQSLRAALGRRSRQEFRPYLIAIEAVPERVTYRPRGVSTAAADAALARARTLTPA